jgi:hypothetical protein
LDFSPSINSTRFMGAGEADSLLLTGSSNP